MFGQLCAHSPALPALLHALLVCAFQGAGVLEMYILFSKRIDGHRPKSMPVLGLRRRRRSRSEAYARYSMSGAIRDHQITRLVDGSRFQLREQVVECPLLVIDLLKVLAKAARLHIFLPNIVCRSRSDHDARSL